MNGRHSKINFKFNKKVVLTLVSVLLVFCSIIGGTVAWLVADTDPVVNTFTYGDIDITLVETDTNEDGDDDPNTNEYPMMPGKELEKDPVITVLADSENSWLFVKLEKTANFDEFLTYDIADGWIELQEGVYYREVNKSTEDLEFNVIKDNKVIVNEDVTKEQLNSLDADPANPDYPKLTVTAYAVQRDDNINTAELAWTTVLDSVNP